MKKMAVGIIPAKSPPYKRLEIFGAFFLCLYSTQPTTLSPAQKRITTSKYQNR